MSKKRIVYVASIKNEGDIVGAGTTFDEVVEICNEYMGKKYSKWEPINYSEHEDPLMGELIYYDALGNYSEGFEIWICELKGKFEQFK